MNVISTLCLCDGDGKCATDMISRETRTIKKLC